MIETKKSMLSEKPREFLPLTNMLSFLSDDVSPIQ
jgi:hypothetical protein